MPRQRPPGCPPGCAPFQVASYPVFGYNPCMQAPPDHKPHLCDVFTPLGLRCQEYATWVNPALDLYQCDEHHQAYRKQCPRSCHGWRKLRVRLA